MHHGGMMMAARDASEVIEVPAAPSNLVATANGTDQIDLTWTDNSSTETEFELQRDNDGDGFPSPVDRTPAADETSFNWTSLPSGTEQWFRIRAVNEAGNSPWSNTDSATTDPAAPDAPSNNSAVADSDSQITQTWEDNSHNEDNFRAQIAEDAGFTTGVQTDSGVAADAEEKVWTGLDDGTEYFTRVRAENTTGNSAYSNTASATTDPTVPDPPDAPSDMVATTASDTEIDLAWTDNSDDEDQFRVQKATDASFTESVGAVTKNADATAHTWPGLDPVVEYFFRVRAENSGGNSDWSNVDSATTDPTTTPAKPENNTLTTDSQTELTQSWDAADQAAEYLVELTEDDSFLTGVQEDTVDGGTTSHQWTGLDPATEYFCKVTAVNSLGESTPSSVADAFTQLAAPTLLTADIQATFTRLEWNDNSAEEQNYEVHRNDALHDTIAADSELYDVQETDNATYKVRAIHSTIPDSDFDEAQALG